MTDNRLPKVIDKVATLVNTRQSGLFHINILHDDWCNLIRDVGDCNCNPEISEPWRHGTQPRSA
ncbi:MAG TPA: hypothetical protein VGM05_13100 [Planctomycetaceae bacterium]|jgi:hypothetical protein